MKQTVNIKNAILCTFIVLLILVQSVFAVGLPYQEEVSSHETVIQQELVAKASYLVIDTRISVAAFLFNWLTKVFTLDISLIAYYNCDAFFVNPHVFHAFYTHLSALAP